MLQDAKEKNVSIIELAHFHRRHFFIYFHLPALHKNKCR